MQTPDLGRLAGAVPGATAPPSWLTDLDAYLQSNSGAEPISVAARRDLVAAVKAQPSSPEAWLAFLSAEEAAGSGGLTATLNGVGTGALSFGGGGGALAHGSGSISLYHMYFWSTQLVPRARHQQKEEYVKLWLGYARQQW